MTVTDSDGDTASGSAQVGGAVSFLDDGPSVTPPTLTSAVVLDETNAGENFGSGPIIVSSLTPIISATPLFGADGAAAADSILYGLSLTGPAVSGLATANGDFPITLVQTNATTITGTYNGGLAAFTLVINADGTLTVTQNVALEHLVDGPTPTDHNDPLGLAGLITATVTVTDSDGDTASGSAQVGGAVSFLDDGPSVTPPTLTSAVVLDETNAGENFGSGPIIVSSLTPIISATPLFGADGAAAADSILYGLSLTGPAVSGLATANGDFPITLVQTNATTITGTYNGGLAAFTLVINADGTLTVTQNVALEHLVDGPTPTDHDDPLGLAGLITATVTVTDSDGDTASGSAQVGGAVSFLDDGPSVTPPTLTSAVVLDETNAGENFGSGPIIVSSLTPIISATPLFGADGAAAADSILYGLSLTGPAVSGLATANGDFPITLVQTNATTITGTYNGGLAAFTLVINADGTLTVTQNVALEHLVDGPTPTDHNDPLGLAGLITATVTVTDSDGDTASGSAQVGGAVSFLDDGPSVTPPTLTSAVVLDETNAGENFGSGPIIVSSLTPIISATPLFGADGAAAADSILYGLSLTGTAVSGLATANGDFPITLVQTNATTITGTYNGGLAAFTLVINADGTLTVTQNVALEHLVDGPTPTDHNDPLGLAGLITATVTVTDSDGDTASGSAQVGGAVSFLDDGPSVTPPTLTSAVVLDETNAGENFGSGPIIVSSLTPIISATPLFGADGAAAADSILYGLSLTGTAVSGLATANGDFPITLVQTNATTITGTYNGGLAAFTLVINADGTLTVTQNVALEHLVDGPTPTDHNDPLGLAGLITATVTVTDSDGDTASGSAQVGGAVSFLDDGPSVTPPTLTSAVVLDETNAGENFGSGPIIVSSLTPIISATPLFRADGAAAADSILYGLSLTGPAVSGLATANGDFPITLVQTNATTITGTYNGGLAAFTLVINADGTLTVTQNVALEHLVDGAHADRPQRPARPRRADHRDGDGHRQRRRHRLRQRPGRRRRQLPRRRPVGDAADADQRGGARRDECRRELGSGPIIVSSLTPIISATPLFGADGAAAADSILYGLSLTGPAVSGLATANGDFPITLVQTNATTITGTYNGGLAAFTLVINADGTLTVTQNVALEHLVDGPTPTDHNDPLGLAGLITATVTVTDSDGDTASGSAQVGGAVSFLDDGPSVTPPTLTSAVVLDETNAGENFGSGPIIVSSLTPIISATPLFGADGAAAADSILYGLSLTGRR